MSHKGSKMSPIERSQSSELETEVFMYNFLKFYITKTVLCILSTFVQWTLDKLAAPPLDPSP